MNYKFKTIFPSTMLIAVVLFGMFIFYNPVFAQTQDAVSEGLDAVSGVNLGGDDIRVIVGRIIQVFLGLLATIAVVLIVYAGFVWMLSGGDEGKISTSKQIMANAAIGLVIILASYSIVTFILNSLKDILLKEGGGWCTTEQDVGSVRGCYDCESGPTRIYDSSNAECTDSLSSLFKTDSTPAHLQENVIRNAVVRMYFNKNVDSDSVSANTSTITVCRVATNLDTTEVLVTDCADGQNLIAKDIEVSGRKMSWHPAEDCGEDLNNDGVNDTICFDSWTKYKVSLEGAQASMVSVNGQDFVCDSDPLSEAGCYFEFSTNNVVDVDYPDILGIEFPADQIYQNRYLPDDTSPVLGTIVAKDDSSEVTHVEYVITGLRDKNGDEITPPYRVPSSPQVQLVQKDTASGVPDTQFPFLSPDWDTAFTQLESGMVFEITVMAYDMNSHVATKDFEYELLAAHCYDNTQNNGEEDVDCGGECLACNGGRCGIITEDVNGDGVSDAYKRDVTDSKDNDGDTTEYLFEPALWCSPNNTQCMSGVCGADCTCEARPVISAIFYETGALGSWVTIQGRNFGNDRVNGASVEFFTSSSDGNDATTYPKQPWSNEAIYLDEKYPNICSGSWSDSEIVVEVPTLLNTDSLEISSPGTLNGLVTRIRVTNSEGIVGESFNTAYSPNDVTFTYDKNNVWPGLCKLSPDKGTFEDAVTGYGKGFESFTNDLLSRKVLFGKSTNSSDIYFEAGNPTFTETQTNFTVPNLSSQSTTVQVSLKNNTGQTVKSNPKHFEVKNKTYSDIPRIVDVLSPNESTMDSTQYLGWGPKDQIITLVGENFGNIMGEVLFIETSSPNRVGKGSIDGMPEMCANGSWTDKQITIKVPMKYSNTDPISEDASHEIIVRRTVPDTDPPVVLQSLDGEAFFYVKTGDAGPGICLVTPSQGPADNTLTVDVYGVKFGNAKISQQIFFSGKNNSNPEALYTSINPVFDWSDTKLSSLIVPSDDGSPINKTLTGPVIYKNGTVESNGYLFTVADCRVDADVCALGTQCCGNGSCSASCGDTTSDYVGWMFSTGKFPESFKVVQQCFTPPTKDANAPYQGQPSPSPSQYEREGTNVCLNARVQVALTEAPFATSITGHIDSDATKPYRLAVYDCGGALTPSDKLDPAVSCTRVDTKIPTAISGTSNKVWTTARTSNAIWAEKTWYKVVVHQQTMNATNDKSFDGNGDGVGCLLAGGCTGEEDSYSWYFRTGPSGTICRVDYVELTPREETLEHLPSWLPYTANPGSDSQYCVRLTNAGIQYTWDERDLKSSNLSDESGTEDQIAKMSWELRLNPSSDEARSNGDNSADAVAARQAVEENYNEADGVKEGDAKIKATVSQDLDANTSYEWSPAEEDQGRALLHVRMLSPQLLNRWPACDKACQNAAVGMLWNTLIKPSDINTTSIQIHQFSCGNKVVEVGESCDDGNAVTGDGCDALCQSEGADEKVNPSTGFCSPSAKSCCGDALIQKPYEECDGKNPFPAYCNSNTCLLEPNPLSCVGGAPNNKIDPGEQCDEGIVTSRCNANCRNIPSGTRIDNVTSAVASVMVDSNDDNIGDQSQINISPQSLNVDTLYCVSVDKKVQSTDNVVVYRDSLPSWVTKKPDGTLVWQSEYDERCYNALKTKYPGKDFITWHFAVKPNLDSCKIADVDIQPVSATVNVIGDPIASVITYQSIPLGSPDECTSAGQRLNSFAYNWTWQSTETKVGVIQGASDGVNEMPLCGNGIREYGEDGDYGQCKVTFPDTTVTYRHVKCSPLNFQQVCKLSSDPANSVYSCLQPGSEHQYLTDHCVNKGTNVQQCGTTPCCGDGTLDSMGEDCDDGNTTGGDGCSTKCQNEGVVLGICGNGFIDNIDTGTGRFSEECDDGVTVDDGMGCSNICTNEGPVKDTLRDPFQNVEGKGVLKADIDSGLTSSSSDILASSGKTGEGLFSVACGFSSDGECPTGGYAVGSDTCCYRRPDVVPPTSPLDGDTNVCRNALVKVTFNQDMDTASFTGNVILAVAVPSTVDCAKVYGTRDILAFGTDVNNSIVKEQSIWQRVVSWVEKMWSKVFGEDANAFASGKYCEVKTTVSNIDERTLVLTPNTVLEVSKNYGVRLLGGSSGTGVKSAVGVSIDPNGYEFEFATGVDICQIDKVDVVIDPLNMSKPTSGAGVKTSDFFTCTNDTKADNTDRCKDDKEKTKLVGTQHKYRVVAKNSAHPTNELVAKYNWSKDPDTADQLTLHYGDLRDTDANGVDQVPATGYFDDVQTIYVTPQKNNFRSSVLVTAQSPDYGFCPNGNQCEVGTFCNAPTNTIACTPTQSSTTVKILTFICENPWPELSRFPFVDPADSDDSDFETYYCRDAGADGVAGDLPSAQVVYTLNNVNLDDDKDEKRLDILLKLRTEGYCSYSDSANNTPVCDSDSDCGSGGTCVRHKYCSVTHTACQSVSDCPPSEACIESGDAVGLRTWENEMHYSPVTWFHRQNLNGKLKSMSPVDGFETYQEGATFYINAPFALDTSNDYFTAMHILSVNPDANEDSLNILNQLVKNLSFATGLSDEKRCVDKVSGNLLDEVCHQDSDCSHYSTGDRCRADKSKVRRDVLRMSQIQDISDWLNQYRLSKGSYPSLSAGSYIAGATLSVWPSWLNTLSAELKSVLDIEDLYIDPVNKLTGCPVGTNPETCWNEAQRKHECPVSGFDWWSYGYEYLSPSEAHVYTNFENRNVIWKNNENISSEILQSCVSNVGATTQYDTDNDKVFDDIDNCPNIPNGNCASDIANCDIVPDGTIGDVKVRATHVEQVVDPKTYTERDISNQSDKDNDKKGDACDICWTFDGKELGNDDDKDSICSGNPSIAYNLKDNCPLVTNTDQKDFDKDANPSVCGTSKYTNPDGKKYCGGNVCDLDADNDKYTKANDCQDTDTFLECQTYITDSVEKYVQFGPDDVNSSIDDVFGGWLFRGHQFFDSDIVSFASFDEQRNDFIMKRGMSTIVPFNDLAPGKYSLRVRSDILSGDETKSLLKPLFGDDITWSSRFHTTTGASCTSKANSATQWQLCSGADKGTTTDDIGGYVDLKITVNMPSSASTKCSQFVHPNAQEVCDTVDNNCDGLTDVLPEFTCSTSKASCNPNDVNTCNSGRSGKCQLTRYKKLCSPDEDLDGWSLDDGDCDDSDPVVYPGPSETHDWENNGNPTKANDQCRDQKDNNCDGVQDWNESECADADNDKWAAIIDCDDQDPLRNPGEGENCFDVIDNNCNTKIDLGDSECSQYVGKAVAVQGVKFQGASTDAILIELLPPTQNVKNHAVGKQIATKPLGVTVATYTPLRKYTDNTPILSGQYKMRIRSTDTSMPNLQANPLAIPNLTFGNDLKIIPSMSPEFYISKPSNSLALNYCPQPNSFFTDAYHVTLGETKSVVEATLCAAESYTTTYELCTFDCSNPNNCTQTCQNVNGSAPSGYIDMVVDIHPPITP